MNTRTPGWCASLHLLSGAKHGEKIVHPLLHRMSAARAAGFTSVGACADDFTTAKEAAFTARHMNLAGMRIGEIEFCDLDGDASPEV